MNFINRSRLTSDLTTCFAGVFVETLFLLIMGLVVGFITPDKDVEFKFSISSVASNIVFQCTNYKREINILQYAHENLTFP